MAETRLDRLEKLMEQSIIQMDKETRKMKEDTRKMKESMDKETKKTEEGMRKLQKETKKLEKIMLGMGLTQGDISENLIFDNFGNVFKEIGEDISSISRNIKVYNKGRVTGEFDIVGINGTKVFIAETKTKLNEEHIDKFVNTTIPTYQKYDKKHDGMKVYGVLGARVISAKVLRYACKKGVYVIKETNNGNTNILKTSLKSVKEFV